MWKGAVAFGLVSVPIKLYAATEDHDVRFHQVHTADGGRVKMLRTCSVDGERLEAKDLSKAYETDDGHLVVMDDADFEELPVPGVKEIEVLEFVPSDQVDPMLFDRSYYLEPEARALKPYVLLREALQETERTAIVRVVLRTKTQLGALRVRDDVLVLQTMLWPDEIRAADFAVLDGEADIRPQELSMASSLIESLSADFDPSQYRDEYREALLAVIDSKVSGGASIVPVAETAASEGDGIVLDLMTALRESVNRSRGGQSGTASADAAEPVAARRRAPKAAAETKATRSTTAKPAAKRAAVKATKAAPKSPAKVTAKKAAPAAKKTERRSA
jgi:DNA end-binding protein Ku